jgi:diaminopimelate decarboxylase
VGLHCHYPYRGLNTFSERVQKLVEIVNTRDLDLDYIDIGGGLNGPMAEELIESIGTRPPSFSEYAETVHHAFKCNWTKVKMPKLLIEPGSALVSDVFDFYTRVVSIKKIGSKLIATVSGSRMNTTPNAKKQFNLPIEVIPVDPSESGAESNEYDVCGYTCIEDDVLFKGYRGSLNVGDVIRFKGVGSYSIVMKPPFILPNYPVYIHDNSGNLVEAKAAESFDNIFDTFNFEL